MQELMKSAAQAAQAAIQGTAGLGGAPPARISQVMGELEALESVLKQIAEQSVHLSSRLSFVLSAETPEPGGVSDEKPQELVPLGMELRRMRHDATATLRLLTSIVNRIEL